MKEETDTFHFSYTSAPFEEDTENDPPDIPADKVVEGEVIRYSGVVPYRRTRRRSRRSLGCSAALICFLLLIAVWILFQQQATITLTLPGVSRTERVQITLSASGKESDAQSSQLHTWTQTGEQTFSITATGHKDVPAVQARGLLLFYNQSPTPKRVAQGTQFQISGLTITLDRDAMIPAASLPTPGQGTFPAHVEQPGPHGNIAAGLLNQLLSESITVTNLAFAGGQDAASLPVLQALDIEQVVKAHQNDVRAQTLQALKTQISSGETLLDQPQCSLEAQPSADAGSTTAQAHVRVQATCSQQSYRRDEVLEKARSWVLTHQAPPAKGYQLVRVQLHAQSISPLVQEKRMVVVTIQENWHYVLPEAQKQQLQDLVAGKSATDAQISVCTILPQCDVTVQYPWIWLPTDGQKIHFSVQYKDKSV